MRPDATLRCFRALQHDRCTPKQAHNKSAAAAANPSTNMQHVRDAAASQHTPRACCAPTRRRPRPWRRTRSRSTRLVRWRGACKEWDHSPRCVTVVTRPRSRRQVLADAVLGRCPRERVRVPRQRRRVRRRGDAAARVGGRAVRGVASRGRGGREAVHVDRVVVRVRGGELKLARRRV